MIHEEICTYEVAKLAKEKGFPHNGHYKYYEFGGSRIFTPTYREAWYRDSPIPNTCVAAPTQSLLQRWLREEKEIHIKISVSVNDKHCFYWTLYSKGCDCWEEAGMCYCEYSTYELALEDALKYALENLV